MPSAPVYRVQGAKTLRRTLKKAGVDVQDLKDAHREAAEIVRAAAAPKTPRRSGTLAGTLKATGSQGIAKVTAGTPSRVPYAGVIHWGWPRRNITAQPWIAEAAQQTETRWQHTNLDAIEKIIDTVEGAPGP
jgi:hypothetical protein